MKIEASRCYYVYILTNHARNIFETGVTGDLGEKIAGGTNGTSSLQQDNRKTCHYLVHYEDCDDPLAAIKREEQIRSYSRKRKAELIDQSNPEWRFLNEDFTIRNPTES